MILLVARGATEFAGCSPYTQQTIADDDYDHLWNLAGTASSSNLRLVSVMEGKLGDVLNGTYISRAHASSTPSPSPSPSLSEHSLPWPRVYWTCIFTSIHYLLANMIYIAQAIKALATAAIFSQVASAHPGHDVSQEIAERNDFYKNSKRDLSHCSEALKKRGQDEKQRTRRQAAIEKARAARGLPQSTHHFPSSRAI